MNMAGVHGRSFFVYSAAVGAHYPSWPCWAVGLLKGSINLPYWGNCSLASSLENLGVWLERPVLVLVMHINEASAIWREIWISGLSVTEAAQKIFSAAQMGPDGIGTQLVQILSGTGANINILLTVAIWIFSQLGVISPPFFGGARIKRRGHGPGRPQGFKCRNHRDRGSIFFRISCYPLAAPK